MPEDEKIRFHAPEVHYPFYANAEPINRLPNNSPCDLASLNAESEQFKEDFKAVFGVYPDEYHLKE